jgi:colicin import membrane protein
MRLFNAQSYTLPAAVSVLLHGIVLYFVIVGWDATSQERKIPVPKYVPAKLVQMEKTAPKAAPKPQPRTIDRAAQQQEKEQQTKAVEAKRQADVAKQQAEKQKQEREKAEREEVERKRREQVEKEKRHKQREQDLADALADEEALLQSEQDAELVNSFSDVIYNKVYRNWSYPPSTRRGMHCKIRVQLVPTGRVVGVTIIERSGNSAFDLSAEQAVWKAEQFPELKDLPARVFEQNFREIILSFDPQDTRL